MLKLVLKNMFITWKQRVFKTSLSQNKIEQQFKDFNFILDQGY